MSSCATYSYFFLVVVPSGLADKVFVVAGPGAPAPIDAGPSVVGDILGTATPPNAVYTAAKGRPVFGRPDGVGGKPPSVGVPLAHQALPMVGVVADMDSVAFRTGATDVPTGRPAPAMGLADDALRTKGFSTLILRHAKQDCFFSLEVCFF